MENKFVPSFSEFLKENHIFELNSIEPILEMAKLNLKDDSTSEFPSNKYRVWVQGDNSAHKPPHMHIADKQEGWELKIYIESEELWQVERFGKRKSTDTFSDVMKLVKSWLQKDTTMPGRIGTNKETAMNEWEACNTL